MKITSANRTSTSYRFTVKMVNGQIAPEDKESVEEMRNIIKNRNAEYRKYRFSAPQKYVKLQGRGPRQSRRYHQALPLGMATSADVYVYNRT
jgi:hypothetical protein